MKIMYGIALSALTCLAAVAQQSQSPFQSVAATSQSTTTVGTPVVLNLTGVTVTDQSGQPIGPIQNILLSPAGCVDMAVLSLGGTKLVPIPWTLVSSGAGATRGETEVAGRTTFVTKVDRTILMQAPSVTVNQITQLSQPQLIQQVQTFYSQHAQSAAGGTGSQTGVNVGGSSSSTNGISTGITNQGTISTQDTNFSPTGPTNGRPGRAFDTNRPPFNRPPANRPPTNRPPAGAPGVPGSTPNAPGQPLQH